MLLDAAKGSSSYIILIYIAIFAFAYFFYLRPRSRKQKAARLETRKVDVGDRAQTIGGFVGTVIKNSTDIITLRTDAGVELDFVPSAIARKFSPVLPESSDGHPTEGDAK